MANEFTDLIKKINSAARSDRNIRISLTSTLAVHKPRIFVQGFDAKGQQIGTYKSKEGKFNKSPRRGKKIILRDSDQMMMDYGLQGANGQYGFGFQNSENARKSEWMEQRFGRDIFDISRYELEVLADVTVFNFIKSL